MIDRDTRPTDPEYMEDQSKYRNVVTNKRITMKHTLSITAVALSLIFSACGGGDSDSSAAQASNQEQTPVESTSDAASVELHLESNDQMQFDKSEFRVKAGQEVTLTLVHTGSMDKAAMGHNFVLLAQGTDIAEFAVQAMSAAENGYIPDSDAIIANTELIGGGETTSVTFTAPAAGTYDFICSFPGHYGVMQGKFIVE